jgi:hypothetical protein
VSGGVAAFSGRLTALFGLVSQAMTVRPKAAIAAIVTIRMSFSQARLRVGVRK